MIFFLYSKKTDGRIQFSVRQDFSNCLINISKLNYLNVFNCLDDFLKTFLTIQNCYKCEKQESSLIPKLINVSQTREKSKRYGDGCFPEDSCMPD